MFNVVAWKAGGTLQRRRGQVDIKFEDSQSQGRQIANLNWASFDQASAGVESNSERLVYGGDQVYSEEIADVG